MLQKQKQTDSKNKQPYTHKRNVCNVTRKVSEVMLI